MPCWRRLLRLPSPASRTSELAPEGQGTARQASSWRFFIDAFYFLLKYPFSVASNSLPSRYYFIWAIASRLLTTLLNFFQFLESAPISAAVPTGQDVDAVCIEPKTIGVFQLCFRNLDSWVAPPLLSRRARRERFPHISVLKCGACQAAESAWRAPLLQTARY